MGVVGVKPCLVRIVVAVGKIQLFSSCLQLHFPCNVAEQYKQKICKGTEVKIPDQLNVH